MSYNGIEIVSKVTIESSLRTNSTGEACAIAMEANDSERLPLRIWCDLSMLRVLFSTEC
jgi:hypothetical protein